ncbi:hypothetical protein GW17_00056354 [Ensete ventricosum]|nr:hypothetical protein GW17_00056354 [Ensete ventricosum]
MTEVARQGQPPAASLQSCRLQGAAARRNARRGGAHGGVVRRCDGRKGSSVRPLAGRLPTGKGSRRLLKGSGGDVVRVREEG